MLRANRLKIDTIFNLGGFATDEGTLAYEEWVVAFAPRGEIDKRALKNIKVCLLAWFTSII
jgi:hypothetical protein